jgi:hypothetical protein
VPPLADVHVIFSNVGFTEALPKSSYRPIPANRTAGEFVIAPQSIPWLNAINDYSKGV